MVKISSSFLEQINSDILPNALMMGVDYDLFWKLNPKSLSPFIKAFSLKQKYDDMMAWNSGIYIKLAIDSIFSKEVKFPNKPLMDTTVIDKSPEELEIERMELIKQRMIERMVAVNSRFEKEEGK